MNNELIQKWLHKNTPELDKCFIKTNYKSGVVEDIRKTAVNFDSPYLVASLTIWESGTVEFIAMKLPELVEVASRDYEFSSTKQLLKILDGAINFIFEQSKA